MKAPRRTLLGPLAILALASPVMAEDLPAPPTVPPAQAPGPVTGTVLSASEGILVVAMPPGPPPTDLSLRPGELVGVYASDTRPDPRGGSPIQGFRYAGDARITWSSGDLLELTLLRPSQVAIDHPVALGEKRGLDPTPAWRPQAPVLVPEPVAIAQTPVAPVAPVAPVVKPSTPPVVREPVAWPHAIDTDGERLASVHDTYDATLGDLRQSMIMRGGFAGDGYDTGLGWWNTAWRIRPEKGPALVEVGIEGLQGKRWVEGSDPDEPWATEPAVSYALWSRVESAGPGLALLGGLGLGVDDQGPALGWLLGVRTGQPLGSHLDLSWENRGRMGHRAILDGRVSLSDAFQAGVRTRLGTIPEHQGDFQQQRLDGALVLGLDPLPRLHFALAAGMGGYDLPFQDAGLVLDGELELRW